MENDIFTECPYYEHRAPDNPREDLICIECLMRPQCGAYRGFCDTPQDLTNAIVGPAVSGQAEINAPSIKEIMETTAQASGKRAFIALPAIDLTELDTRAHALVLYAAELLESDDDLDCGQIQELIALAGFWLRFWVNALGTHEETNETI